MDLNSTGEAARKYGCKVDASTGDFSADGATEMLAKATRAAGVAVDAMSSALDTAERWMDEVSKMAKNRPLTTVTVAVFVGYTLRAVMHPPRG